jgi:adenine-specific DNA-methyltransferase
MMPVMLKMEIKKLRPKNRRYLGSKTRLLKKITEVVEKECADVYSFLDLFAGTGVVGEAFNKENISVIFNDNLTSNYYSYVAWFGNEVVNHKLLGTIISGYNNISVSEDNYVSYNFSDTFFSKENCRKIGFIREDIEKKHIEKIINDREKAILITSLLFSMDRIANTVGHYDAYRRNGDLERGLVLYDLEIPDNVINFNNKIFCEDANQLVRHVKADLVYIDPPYNSRQYCDAYHFLENIADWKQPEVEGVAKKFNRDHKKSKYSLRSAPKYFSELIEGIEAKYILVSYNNMAQKGASRSNAKISDFEILDALSKKGKVIEFNEDFQPFTTGKGAIENHKERLFLCKVGLFDNKFDASLMPVGYVKSPLNYTGGKYKLLNQIIDKFPNKIDMFIDLFAGGFNVGANVEAHRIIYNDKQLQVQRIIQLIYSEETLKIINKIENIIKDYELSDSQKNGYEFYDCNSNSGLGSYNKSKYYKLRDDYNSLRSSKKKDYLLLTLIIYSFNNQIRFNNKNEYNMPVGKRDFNASIKSNLIGFSSLIKSKSVTFFNLDFSKIEIPKNAFVYCDPPYLLGNASYNESNGWNEFLEIRLLNLLKDLDDKGVKFAVSNVIEHKGKLNSLLNNWIEKNHFNKIYIRSTYNNSNYHLSDKNGLTREVLITNY